MFVDKGTGNEDVIFSDGDNVGEHTFVGRLGVPLSICMFEMPLCIQVKMHA